MLNIIRKTQYGYALENISKNEIKNYIKLLEREFEVTKEHEIIETYFNLLIAIGEEKLAF